jgi:hypothetical protein
MSVSFTGTRNSNAADNFDTYQIIDGMVYNFVPFSASTNFTENMLTRTVTSVTLPSGTYRLGIFNDITYYCSKATVLNGTVVPAGTSESQTTADIAVLCCTSGTNKGTVWISLSATGSHGKALSGTSTARTADSLTLDNTASGVADYYNGHTVAIANQYRYIDDYGTDRIATVASNWDPVPAAVTPYAVFTSSSITGSPDGNATYNVAGAGTTTVTVGDAAGSIPLPFTMISADAVVQGVDPGVGIYISASTANPNPFNGNSQNVDGYYGLRAINGAATVSITLMGDVKFPDIAVNNGDNFSCSDIKSVIVTSGTVLVYFQ